MLKQLTVLTMISLALAGCSSNNQPRIVQTSPNAQEVRLTPGTATQIEIAESERVQSVVIGNPAIATDDYTANVISLSAKGATGETNMIIRAVDEDGHATVYQYRITVTGH